MSFSFPTKQPQPHKLRLFVQSHRLRNVMTDRLINSLPQSSFPTEPATLTRPSRPKTSTAQASIICSLAPLTRLLFDRPSFPASIAPRSNRQQPVPAHTAGGRRWFISQRYEKFSEKTARRAKTVPQHPTESTWHRHTFRSDTPLPAPPCRRSSHSRNRQRPPPSSTAWSMAAGNWIPSHRPR